MLDKWMKKGRVLIPYFTFADPSIEFTRQLIHRSFDNGADIVELGLPFSDPLADGPVIHASHQRALLNFPTVKQAFELILEIRQTRENPLIVMGGVNLIFRYGVEAFFADAAAHKVSGVVIPDLPVEEADDYIRAAKLHHVALIFLVSPLCEPERLVKIVNASTGFVYLVSSTGTTGERQTVSSDLSGFAKRIRDIRAIPVAVGFGLSTPEHVAAVYMFAEGAIVGSFLVRIVETYLNEPEVALEKIGAAIAAFKQ